MGYWKARISASAKADALKRGIPEADIIMMIGLFLALETVEDPRLVESVRAIRITNFERYRQRLYAGSKPRVIFTVNAFKVPQPDGLKGTLHLKAILPKDDNIYRIAYEMWLDEP